MQSCYYVILYLRYLRTFWFLLFFVIVFGIPSFYFYSFHFFLCSLCYIYFSFVRSKKCELVYPMYVCSSFLLVSFWFRFLTILVLPDSWLRCSFDLILVSRGKPCWKLYFRTLTSIVCNISIWPNLSSAVALILPYQKVAMIVKERIDLGSTCHW